MKEASATGGYSLIYEDLLKRLKHADISASAQRLDLALNNAGEVEIPFFGKTYLISKKGVRCSDGHRLSDAIGSVLIYYILKGSPSRPVEKFVTLAELAGPLFKQGSYSTSALERPIIKRFQGHVPELIETAALVGGRQGGEAGLGSVSMMFDLLPHIPIQLIFYDRDNEFPARATLLFDRNATQLVDFEVLAVLITLFVQSLVKL